MQALPAESLYPLNFARPPDVGFGRAHATLPAPPFETGSAQKCVAPGRFSCVEGSVEKFASVNDIS